MPSFTILYDEPHEAEWFRNLHQALSNAGEESITAARTWPGVQQVLAYDRPDIVLLDEGVPILVVEETVEVPSGHNVGQRFARIAAAAEAGVPSVYFGPYVARKHGGETAGPRYMNARLFHALDAMERVTGAAVTTINWPVDEMCEVRRDPDKDADMREYISAFLHLYAQEKKDLARVNAGLIASPIHARMIAERDSFVATAIRNPSQYDGPPASVEFISRGVFERRIGSTTNLRSSIREVVLYNVGMRGIRSDPYTGMSILYKYLYISEHPSRALVLWFPHISTSMWSAAAQRGNRKDIRLYKVAADAILFSDGLRLPSEL